MKTALNTLDQIAEKADAPVVKPLYIEALTLVERLHRRLLDVIKDEFDLARLLRREQRAGAASL